MANHVLATFVMLFHVMLIAFSLLAPFSNSNGILVLHITWCLTLILHWVASSNACSLTLLESKLRGLDCTETFMHRLISPFYDIQEGVLSKIIYITTILLMAFSVYKLYTSEKFNKILSNIYNGIDRTKNLQMMFSV
jgi:hypothetical protein